MALPPLTPEQRQAALDKAAASRRERAEVKNRLKHSGATRAGGTAGASLALFAATRRREQNDQGGDGGDGKMVGAQHTGRQSGPVARPAGKRTRGQLTRSG